MQVIDYDFGISAIDSGYVRPGLDAIHLIVEGSECAIVDTGTNDSIPAVLEALTSKGLPPDAVRWLILTHVHLDHAGGAGLLLSKLPNAQLVVHPRGARHMIDPAKLMAGTIAVYGEQAARKMYGTLMPIPADRVVEATDGLIVRLGSRALTFYDTPGHARHHVCIFDARSQHLFTGDMFGLSYRELDRGAKQFVFPATTPIQFDPQAFHSSIQRMLALGPKALYMTHYGRVTEVHRLAADLLRLVDAHAELARRVEREVAQPDRLDALKKGVLQIALEEARRQEYGIPNAAVEDVLSMDIALNAAGLLSWIEASPKMAS